MQRLALLTAVTIFGAALCPASGWSEPLPAGVVAGDLISTELSGQSRQQVRPRIRVRPAYRYPYRTFHSPYPVPYPYEYPGPNAYRDCRARLVQEFRPSGTVIVPRVTCWWVNG
jgi:hypothetical protein